MNSNRNIGHRIAHQGEDAGTAGTRTKGALRMEAQHVVDRRRQLANIDAAGVGEVALAYAAGERRSCVPNFQCEGDARGDVLLLRARSWTGPSLQCSDGLGAGHVLDSHEPIDAITVGAAGVAMEMIRIDAAGRVRVVVKRT